MAVPVRDGARTVAILYVCGQEPRWFDAEDEELLGALAESAGVLIHHHQMTGPARSGADRGRRTASVGSGAAPTPTRRPAAPPGSALAIVLADQAVTTLELAERDKAQLAAERGRIARDLHDHVVQQLFAVGLSIQHLAEPVVDTDGGRQLLRGLDGLDEAIRQIRTTIFQLRGPVGGGPSTVRNLLLDVAGDLTPALGFAPRVGFTGPIDTVVPEELLGDLVAVLRESLTNVARHARASHVRIDVEGSLAAFSVTVTDDGIGVRGGAAPRSGLANLSQRAAARGGTFSMAAASAGAPHHFERGTEVSWRVPLS